MPSVIVADASCLILFHKIGELDLLGKVYGQILITQTVADEFRRPLPEWVHIQNPTTNLYKGLIGFLDAGEATAIALAAEHPGALLIIDELKGRKAAKELAIDITGSLGVLVAAKETGALKAVKPVLGKIKQTNFRLSDDLLKRILSLVNEI